MPESGWERWGLILAAVLTALGIIARLWKFPLRWVAKHVHRLAAWAGRRIILATLRSDKNIEARAYILTLVDEEMAKINAKLDRTKRDLGALEDTVVHIEEAVRLNTKMGRDIHVLKAQLREITQRALPEINRKLHTVVGLLRMPETLAELDIAARQRREEEDNRDHETPNEDNRYGR